MESSESENECSSNGERKDDEQFEELQHLQNTLVV